MSLRIASSRARDEVPTATVERLPVYLHALDRLRAAGIATVSSADLAERSGVTSAKLRKDLSYLGSLGTRGVGYDVEFLHGSIATWLGVSEPLGVVIVGLGNLGHALATYRGFATGGFRVVGLVDVDPDRGSVIQEFFHSHPDHRVDITHKYKGPGASARGP